MVTREQIQALADDIAAKFPEVEKIILFGSYAYGTPREDSDVDLLVIGSFESRTREIRSRIHRAVDPGFSWDLLTYTLEDATRRYEQFDPFLRHAFDGGEVLYERRVARMG